MKQSFTEKFKTFLKKWKRAILVLLGIILITTLIFVILKKIGILTVDTILSAIKEHEAISILIFILVRTVAIIFFGFVPGIGLIFETVVMLMWGANFKGFCIAYVAIIISSLIEDAIGRFGGSKIIVKLVGKEVYEDAVRITSTKGLVYVPFMYLFPFFPDDAICMLAGTSGIKWTVNLIYILFFRGVGTAVLFGSINIIPESIKTFTDPNPLNYIRLIVWAGLCLIVLFKWIRKLDKYLTKRMKKYNKNKNAN